MTEQDNYHPPTIFIELFRNGDEPRTIRLAKHPEIISVLAYVFIVIPEYAYVVLIEINRLSEQKAEHTVSLSRRWLQIDLATVPKLMIKTPTGAKFMFDVNELQDHVYAYALDEVLKTLREEYGEITSPLRVVTSELHGGNQILNRPEFGPVEQLLEQYATQYTSGEIQDRFVPRPSS